MDKSKIIIILILLLNNSCTQKNNKIFRISESGDNYDIFQSNLLNYGIVDKSRNIIIPAKYEYITRRYSDNYYLLKLNNNYVLFWLDSTNKKLIKLHLLEDYHFSINKEMDVFVNKDQVFGVLKNRSDTILPFKYSKFEKIGDNFFGKLKNIKSSNIFDLKLNELPSNGISDFNLLSKRNKLIKVQNSKNNYGIIDYDLKFIVPFEYYSINTNRDYENYFIVTKRHINGNDLMYGVMNVKGEIIVPLIYNYIRESDTENFKVIVRKNNNFETKNFYEFVKENSK